MLAATTRSLLLTGCFVATVVGGGAFVNASAASSGKAVADSAGSEVATGDIGARRVNIRIAIGSTTMIAALEDNPTARDFAALLPLTVTLRDFSSAEKISDALPKRLSEEGARATDAGAVGDIAYYAPWGNLAFFRGHGPNAAGVIKIATIHAGIEALDGHGKVRVTITRVD